MAANNNISATTQATFSPKKGRTRKPTSGNVHSQTTKANVISSE